MPEDDPAGGQHSFVTYSRWVADRDHKLGTVVYNLVLR
jgi:hypothetical protein